MISVSRSRWLASGGLLLILLLAALYIEHRRDSPPDFQDLTAGEPRKQAFFAYFRPLIDRANSAIADDRVLLETIAGKGELSNRELRALQQLARDYELETADQPTAELLEAALLRVDELPASLILAQAAKESGWGTSRFAVSAHNYFGQRCWQAGCGITPKQRPAGATFEVTRFASPYESVRSYLQNINTHAEYAELRASRYNARQQGISPSGLQLAEHLGTYSEREAAYINEIRGIITTNKLESLP